MAAPLKHVLHFVFQNRQLFCSIRQISLYVSRKYSRRMLIRKPINVFYDGKSVMKGSMYDHDDGSKKPKQISTSMNDGLKKPKISLTGRKHQAYDNSSPELHKIETRERSNDKINKSANVVREKRRFCLPENVQYERLEEGDHRFGRIVMAAKSKKLRHKQGVILLEGQRLILEAIEAGIEIRSLFFDHVEALEGLPFTDFKTLYYSVRPSQLKTWSDLSTPPGLMAICTLPATSSCVDHSDTLPITLVLDNIRDPGNMGTLLRTAAGVGCHCVLVTKGCVDIWDPKVLRAAAGSHFKVNIIPQLGWEYVGGHLPEKTFVTLADNIPNKLNSHYKHVSAIMKAVTSIEHSIYTEVDEITGEKREIDESYLDSKTVDLFKKVPITESCLYDTDMTNCGHVTVVVGGETEGISNAARKLAFDRNGECVYIPMAGGVESLNAGTATSVILFEVKRQMLIGRFNLPVSDNEQ